MNYNTIAFAPAATASRSIKGHALNIGTYLLITAVIVLTAIKNGFDWLAKQYDDREIYHLQIQLKQALAKRFIVRQAIRLEKFRLNNTPHVVSVMDRVFCLTD